MRKNSEKGQAILLAVVAMGIFLVGALGLAIDGAHLYGHRQMAQSAADAAAQAGILSIFNGTNTGTNAFGSATHTCSTTDPITPCAYARNNGFGATAEDVVTVDFPSAAAIGLDPASLATGSSPNILRVTITRNVTNGIIRMLGASATTPVTAVAAAAIVDVVAPVPILVTHPYLNESFRIGGNPQITICGGPGRSIQVNSSSGTSIGINGNAHLVDLSHAGPNDDGFCNTGTGADFGDFGGPDPFPGNLSLGTTGNYIQPASPIWDPLRDVPAPALPPAAPAKTPLANGQWGCPAAPIKPCQLYYPGAYPTGIHVQNETAVFTPGLYYMQSGGFGNFANGELYMCTGCPADAVTANGMVVYNTGGGTFNVGANGSAYLMGAPANSIYKGILLFNDRTAATAEHRLGGGGTLSLRGTIYINNTLALMEVEPVTSSTYQTIVLQGTPGSETLVDGMIITSVLKLQGNSGIKMKLDPLYKLNMRQVALVR